MATDVKTELVNEISSKMFAVQLDESTNNRNKAILLVYVRYLDKENKTLSEQFMMSIALPGHTTGEDIFKAIDKYFKLKKTEKTVLCVSFCSNGQ